MLRARSATDVAQMTTWLQHASTSKQSATIAKNRDILPEFAVRKAIKPSESAKQKPGKNLFVQEETPEESQVNEHDDVYELFYTPDLAQEPELLLDDVPVSMVMDTGASLSIISKSTYDHIHAHNSALSLTPSSACLQTYTGELLPILGASQLSVRYGT